MARTQYPIGSACSTALSAVAVFILSASVAAQAPAGPPAGKQPPPAGQLPPPALAPVPFCFGDGTQAACPCDNTGMLGRGCQNSALTGGALLWAAGAASISADSLQLNVSGELPTSLSIVLQGSAVIRPARFGDGLRCVGGSLTRLYAQGAIGGMVSVPQAADLAISARSAALGDPLANGDVRCYQVFYRDPRAAFCGQPAGSGFNISNGVSVIWTK